MFSLEQVTDRVWHLNFKYGYDLNLHFFRYQEYYESPKFKKAKNVQFIDLMDWYSNHQGKGEFTYISDWAGFNLPAEKIFELEKDGIQDKNRYDEIMLGIAKLIRAKEAGNEDFYIIGTASDDSEANLTFNHELAHSLFYINEKYREEAVKLVDKLPKREKNFIFKKIKECGYDDDVLIDECQAYMATGLYLSFDKPSIRKHTKPFKALFNKYAGEMKK
jgi:hypothetical protein